MNGLERETAREGITGALSPLGESVSKKSGVFIARAHKKE